MIIEEDSLDDLLNSTFSKIMRDGEEIASSKGKNSEIRNAQLVLNNPRARLSISESRSRLISCVGEFFWYLSGNDSLEFIEYYISNYRTFIDYKEDEEIPALGAYGPRIFGEQNQFEAIEHLLREKPDSRRAVISIYDKNDVFREDNRDIPCTCSLQFFIRDNTLHLTTIMRSNDAATGLVHDLFSFTLIQEIMWAKLARDNASLKLGTYTHIVGSLHIYHKDMKTVNSFLDVEGWQSKVSMEKINPNYLEDDLNIVMQLEQELRTDSLRIEFDLESIKDIFWQEIAVILLAYYYIKKEEYTKLKDLKDVCSSKPVLYFLNKRINKIDRENFI